MKRCAFLSMDNLDAFECYDRLLFDPLKTLGWSAEEISWRNKKVDWNQFEAVIIRSPWDYQQDPDAFLQTLNNIEESSARLENSLDLVKWNIDKTYLKDLEEQGFEIVPSLWGMHFEEDQIDQYYEQLETSEIIIKPTVSAGADDTFWIDHAEYESYLNILAETFDNRPFLIQPFMQNIIEEGEFSVFFFGDTYSHTILKTPQKDDFRVQEEHGGSLKKVKPEPILLTSARELLQNIDPMPLYSRMDYVRTPQNTFALMELELIEPSLYFNMDPESPQRFAEVFDTWMQHDLANSPQVGQ